MSSQSQHSASHSFARALTSGRQEARHQQVVEAVDRLEVQLALHPLHLFDDVERRV